MKTKNILPLITALLVMLCTTSCLTSGLEEIDTYKGNEITSIHSVYHRYYGSDKVDASGEQVVKQSELRVDNVRKDVDAATIACDVTIPTNFPADQVDKVTASNLVVILNISTAAIIEPLEDAPTLGVPGDWSAPRKYRVRAANGEMKTWTVSLSLRK